MYLKCWNLMENKLSDGSKLSRNCGNLDVSQLYGSPRPRYVPEVRKPHGKQTVRELVSGRRFGAATCGLHVRNSGASYTSTEGVQGIAHDSRLLVPLGRVKRPCLEAQQAYINTCTRVASVHQNNKCYRGEQSLSWEATDRSAGGKLTAFVESGCFLPCS
jgi:hypothetical protein